MTVLPTLFQTVQRALGGITPDAAPDFQLAFALTQLLIDSGRVDAAGCVVIASWRTPTHALFEVVCAERIRTSMCGLLGHVLSRPFQATDQTWLLSQREASTLIDLSIRFSA
jgi:hypothetical protein